MPEAETTSLESAEPTGDQWRLIAYPVAEPLLELAPAPAARAWMEKTTGGFATNRFAYRCLPMLIANQSGWLVLNSHRFFVVWNGGDQPSDLKLVFQGGAAPYPALSHFGTGILTFNIPYLFRTPPGYNLLARGPANMPKDGASPLEGVIETSWTDAKFTMNWQITRPNVPVIFGVDEPICMLVPQRSGELEMFKPEIRALESDPEVSQGFSEFREARLTMQAKLSQADPEAVEQGWLRKYFTGSLMSGQKAPEHQTKLHLRSFAAADATAAGESDRRQGTPVVGCPFDSTR